MNKKEKDYSIGSILFCIFFIAIVIFMGLIFEKDKTQIHEYYQVYLSGDKIGIVANEEELYTLIDKEEDSIKKKYNVENVYPPQGLVIQKVLTYDTRVTSASSVYEKIKEEAPFTIEGYQVSVTKNNKKTIFYLLNKEDLDTATKNTVLAFVDEQDYNDYINGVQKEITDEGTEITDIYFQYDVKIKKTYISTDEKIFTDADELSQYFLFGTTELKETYKVKKNDTIEKIADKNHLGVSDFLIANPSIVSEKALLAVGQVVNVAAISPISNIVVESLQTSIASVPYDTKIQYDDTLTASTSYVKQKGVNGKSKVTYATQELNGTILKTSLVSEKTISQPVDKIVVMGSKATVHIVGSGNYAWPTDKPYRISSNYGWRICPFHGKEFHPAIDITGTKTKNVYAIQDGVVKDAVKSGYNSGYGKYISISHDGGLKSQYLHLSRVIVNKGDKVVKGQLIGIIGCTGSCTGNHLDFRVYKNGSSISPWSLYK